MTPETIANIARTAIEDRRWEDAFQCYDKLDEGPSTTDAHDAFLNVSRSFWLTAQEEGAKVPSRIADLVWDAPPESACYQHDLLAGEESWSGSTLSGRARSYAGHYASSRQGLLDRIRAAVEPEGWTARVPLVFDAESRRYTRRLVLFDDKGKPYIW